MAGNVFGALAKGLAAKALAPVDNRGGWYPYVREPYSGAWQNNDSWTVESVLAYGPVYACVTLIASDIGKLPFTLVRKDRNGIWAPTSNPPVEQLLRRPNGYQNHIQFKEWWSMSKLTRGNTYAIKERNAQGRVVALHILDPSYVSVLVSDSGAVFYQLHQDSLSQVVQGVTVPASEVIHDRMNCLYHPLVGVSPLFASGLAASQGLKIQNDSKEFFENGARPSGILTAPGNISDETAARLKSHWESEYTGTKAGKVAVLGDDLKYEPMRMNAVDSQMIEQLRWTAEDVCSTFKVPPYKIGVGPTPPNNNIEALTKDYYTQCLQSPIEQMELALQEGLGLELGVEIRLDLDVLFRMDMQTLVGTLKEGVLGALFAPDEARRRINLPPVQGGNVPYLQQQNYSLAALARRDAEGDTAPVASSAMAGGQVTALQGLLDAVATGRLSPAAVVAAIAASFPDITQSQAQEMVSAVEIKPPQPVAPAADDDPDDVDEQARHFADLIEKELGQ